MEKKLNYDNKFTMDKVYEKSKAGDNMNESLNKPTSDEIQEDYLLKKSRLARLISAATVVGALGMGASSLLSNLPLEYKVMGGMGTMYMAAASVYMFALSGVYSMAYLSHVMYDDSDR